MTKIIGKTILNQYRVEEFIASGGMGAVYRVQDLKRNVPLAMKVLSVSAVDDADSVRFFKREANALRKLTHPNIVPFYGFFQTDELAFLLEYFINGPTLKDILNSSPGRCLSIEQALSILKPLCAALGYAHSQGVVHCDIKPGNVMVDQGGHVYLADFGVARHAESTTTTLQGAGTAAYMAPEQIRLEPLTAAADIYALGVLLYELLSGQRPFKGTEGGTESKGETANERIRYAHLMLPPPDPRSFNPNIPPELARAILKALAKNPQDRYPSTGDFLDAVCRTIDIPQQNLPDRISLPAEFAAKISPEPPPHPDVNVPNRSPAYPQMAGNNRRAVPYILFAAALILVVGGFGLFRGLTPVHFAPTATIQPVLSGQIGNITTISDNKTGSIGNNLAPTAEPTLPSAVIPTLPPTEPPMPTPPVIPTATPAIQSIPGEPTGKIVFTCQIGQNADSEQICLINADGTGWKQLTNNPNSSYFYPSLAPDGNSVVFAAKVGPYFQVKEMDLAGNQRPITDVDANAYAPEISRDGSLILFTHTVTNVRSTLWLVNRDGSNPHQIIPDAKYDAWDPVWANGGREILFASNKAGENQIFIMNVDGTNIHQVGSLQDFRGRSDWSPDNQTVATYQGKTWEREVVLMDVDGSNLRKVSHGGNSQGPSFSPDGKWIAFTSYYDHMHDENGCEIYIMRVDGSDLRRLTDNNYCDYQPRWGP